MKKPIKTDSKKDLHNTFVFILSGINFIIFASNLLPHLVLKKRMKKTDLQIQGLPESLKDVFLHDGIYENEGICDEGIECIEEFLEVFKSLDHVDLTRFYENLKPNGIRIQKIDHKFGFKVSGEYVPSTREIHYNVPNIREVIFHELLHLASTRLWGHYCFCGFDQSKDTIKNCKPHEKYRIGIGLNEGYTELLTQRYFFDKGIKTSYPLLVDIAFFIESLIGQKRMEEHYFKGDLYGLISCLEQYATHEEVILLLRRIDYIHDALYGTIMPYPKLYIKSLYNEIVLSIARMLLVNIKISKDIMDPDVEILKDEVALFYSLKNHMRKEDVFTFKSTNRTKKRLDLYANMILVDSPHIKRLVKDDYKI